MLRFWLSRAAGAFYRIVTTRIRGAGRMSVKDTLAVGARFHCEFCDLYHGQFSCVFFLHDSRIAFYIRQPLSKYSRFFGGLLQYLVSLDYLPGSDRREVLADPVYDESLVTVFGRRVALVTDYPGALPPLPMSTASALQCYSDVAADELRGRMRPARVHTFLHPVASQSLLMKHLGTKAGAATIPEWGFAASDYSRMGLRG